MDEHDQDLLKQLVAFADPSGYSVRTWNEKEQKWWYRPVDKPITDDVLAQHLERGEDCVGIWLNKDDGEKSQLCVLDFDDHTGTMTRDAVVEQVRAVAEELTKGNVPHLTFISGGGHGAHIWIGFAEPRRTDTIREFAAVFLKRAGLEGKSGGKLIDNQVEVLPKGSGRQVVALPYGRKSAELILHDGSYSLNTGREVRLELYQGKKAGRKKAAESDDVDREAAFDCFVKKYHVDDYSDWCSAGVCLQAAFGKENTWARERWVEWSKTGSTFTPPDAEKWNKLGTAKKYTPLSFWRFAKDNGYSGKSPFTATEQRKLLPMDFLADVKIIRDQSDVAYAELKPRDFVRIDTNEFREVCALALYNMSQRVPAEADVKGAQMVSIASARDIAAEHVALRFAKAGGKRYVYLADKERNIIEIDDDGWRVNNDAPVQFRKGVCLPMTIPVDAPLSELIDFLNVDDESMVFLLAWMVTAIVNPGEQCPIAILDGSAGSAKSSALTTIIGVIDPKVATQNSAPSSEDDLVVTAYASAVMSFDNVTSIAKLSDALCRLATGGGLSKRRLYSDGDVFAMSAMRPVMVAGLDPTFYKQDLIERIIRVTLTRPKVYLDEEEFRARRDELMPGFRGALFSLASRVLRNMAAVEPAKSRFGVFSRVGECVARELGWEAGWFVHRYAQMQMQLAIEAATADSVYIFLSEYLRGIDKGIGTTVSMTATELFVEMKTVVGELTGLVSATDLPGNARAISPRIVQSGPLLLKDQGWEVTRGRSREFVLKKVAEPTEDAERVLDTLRERVPRQTDAPPF